MLPFEHESVSSLARPIAAFNTDSLEFGAVMQVQRFSQPRADQGLEPLRDSL
jgi:hypothetical protein